MITLLDYGMGNILSVKRACEHVGMKVNVASNSESIINSKALIIPGVGAFDDAIQRIHDLDIYDTIIKFKESGRYIIGICLGMQLIMEYSDESKSDKKGFGFISGGCHLFPNVDEHNNVVKVPQIMWNKININYRPVNDPFEDIDNNQFMYFVHSFYVKTNNDNNILSTTDYGGVNYASSVISDNVLGFQFHPEKSGENGIKIYSNLNNLIDRHYGKK